MPPMKSDPPQPPRHLAGTLSLDQLARRWKTSRKQIRRLMGHQLLGFVQIRGSFRVPISEVERYERRQRSP